MWTLKNTTPYAAGRTWMRDREGVHQWIVVVKATFDVNDAGRVSLSEEQAPPILTPEYTGEPGLSSLRYDADLVAQKPTTDIVLLGQAHAPHGRATSKVAVSLRVGSVYKELLVFGPRVYYPGLSGQAVSSPVAFASQEIAYELAYGGSDLRDPDPRRQLFDKRNPVGRGVGAQNRGPAHQPAHQIEYPSGDPTRMGPAGFGPVASNWSPRLQLAGTYDQRWQDTRKPLLPVDYDPRFELCAPADQRPARHLEGNEPVELINLTPTGRLRFSLPRLDVSLVTAFGRRKVEHGARLAGVVLEPARHRVLMTWQSSLAVTGRECDYLDGTTVNVRTA
jgi:hypothetical protein